MSEPERCFADIVTAMQEAHSDGLRAFAQWLSRHWGITREEWQRDFDAPVPVAEWFDGHKAALESVADAVECYIEEQRRGRHERTAQQPPG